MDSLKANVVDIVAEDVFYAEIVICHGRISAISRISDEQAGRAYLMPGFVDAHVHIESSMLIPDEFARAALPHGTLASVSDPHEIANVLGIAGIKFMQQRAALTPFKILFGAPSCVPATPFESSGATIDAQMIHRLLEDKSAAYLSEVMNFPGVLNNDAGIMEKIKIAKDMGVPVDGHAPGLQGDDAKRYAAAGISSDHECTTLEEALDKIKAGMKILIREGSAAKNFSTLHPLIQSHPDSVMLCSDDKHPDDLLEGHINQQVVWAIEKGYPLFNILRTAILNPIKHYGLELGLLQCGDSFDAILVNNLKQFKTQKAWLNGQLVYDADVCLLEKKEVKPVNYFKADKVGAEQLKLRHPASPCKIITARDGTLYTGKIIAEMPEQAGYISADQDSDILFLVVLNRYTSAPPAIALIQGFGIKGCDGSGGAIASSVAHDSHNIVAVGSSAFWLEKVINEVIDHQGGLAAVDSSGMESLPLPIAGLMSDQPVELVGPSYRALNSKAKSMGSPLSAPFMTLSFMSLLVIPELKLSDKGLFDGRLFEFTDLAEG